MAENREKERLQLLGQTPEYRQDYAPQGLETFDNYHPPNDH